VRKHESGYEWYHRIEIFFKLPKWYTAAQFTVVENEKDEEVIEVAVETLMRGQTDI